MRLRRLGERQLEVSELALGTWGLSGEGYARVSEADQDRVIERALALGITLFDTADSYAHGAMEQRLGRLVPDDERHHVFTKIGTFRGASPARKRFDAVYLRHAIKRSQERLRRSVTSCVLLHNPSAETLERGEATDVLEELKSKGQIRLWGVSASSAHVARAALLLRADVVSLPYNAFHSGELHAVHSEIRESGAGVLAHSVLAYGMLCGKWSSDKEFGPDDHRAERWTIDEFRRRIRQLDALRPAVSGNVLTMRAVALRYVLGNTLVSSALLGPRSSVQLDQLVREAGREPPYMTDDVRFALEARLRDVGVSV
jgi:aryl-alcohol dehydrogenase-like predicted oxidoreductase